MKGFKTLWRYARITLRDSLHNISIYIILGLIFLVAQYYCPEIGSYLKENGDRLNFWELYVWSMSTRQAQFLYLAGVVGVTSQIVKLSGGTALYLARMNRRSWVRAQMMSLFFHIVGLNLFLLVCFAIASGGRLTMANEWSRAAVMAAQFQNAGVIGLQGVLRVSYNLLAFSPYLVGGLSFLLSILLGMVMGLAMMVFALRQSVVFGGMVLFVLWFMEVLVESVSMFEILRYALPFSLARISYTSWNYGTVTPEYCVLFLVTLSVFLMWFSDWICEWTDFMKLG